MSEGSRTRVAVAVAVGGLLWAALALWFVPGLIRDAYAGESLDFFNRLITGQDVHPVDRYLDAWSRLAMVITAVLIGVAALVGLSLRFSAVPKAVGARLEAKLPALRARDVVVLAVLTGVGAGLAESARRVISYRVFRRAAGEVVSGEVFWMAPAAASIVMVAIAVTLVVVGRWRPVRGVAHGVAPFLFMALAVYSFGRSLGVGVHPLAVLALAVGAGSAFSGALVGRGAFLRSRGTAVAAITVLLIGSWAIALDPIRRSAAALRAGDSVAAPEGAPNVVVIVWDTVRALSLSLYGHERPTTPNLDALAADAVVFERAVAPAPWTLPSHASLFTGAYHHEHSARHDAPLDDALPTLSEVLAANGYHTAGFVANEFWGGTGFGLQRGFHWYEYWKPTSFSLVLSTWWASGQIGWRVGSFLDTWARLRIDADQINGSFLGWLDERRDVERPFFAFLNLFDAHEPYLPPPPFGFRFADGEPMYAWKTDPAAAYTDEELQELRDAYDSCIYYLDDRLRLLLDELDARGELDNTLVVLTSDHGETLGEHRPDLLGHENNVYHDVLNVPLVVYYPARFDGARRPMPVSLVDVPRTVVEAVGITDHPFPGRSLVPLLDGSDVTAPVSPLLSQTEPVDWHLGYTHWPIATGPLYSLVEDDLHFIVDAEGDDELYDLSQGVWRADDVSETAAGRVDAQRLGERISALLRSRPADRR